MVTLTCPACPAWAEQVDGEPVLAPWLLNVERCTEACAERHTYRQGCGMRPSAPLRTPPTAADEPRWIEGNPVPMPAVDAAGQAWWKGKPWPPRNDTAPVLHDHQVCERCDVTDPCGCCGIRFTDGRWVNADGTPATVASVATGGESVPWGGDAQDCNQCTADGRTGLRLCPGHPAPGEAQR